MGLLLGDVYLSEMEISDKPYATTRLERPNIKSLVQDSAHSVISSPNILLDLSITKELLFRLLHAELEMTKRETACDLVTENRWSLTGAGIDRKSECMALLSHRPPGVAPSCDHRNVLSWRMPPIVRS